MGHRVALFVGPLVALRALAAAAAGHARAFALRPAATMFVLPVTDDVHDAWHMAFGTGDWLETGPMLTSTDMALAERASRGTALAYIETDYFGGVGRQSAVLWRDGVLVLRPSEFAQAEVGDEALARPLALRPINAALRGLGLIAATGLDEFDTLGLGEWRTTDDIAAEAFEVRLD